MITVHDLCHVEPDVAEAWIATLSSQLRAADIDEIEAMAGTEPDRALRDSLSISSHAYAVVSDTYGPVAIFGAAPHPLAGVGVVWMLGSDGIKREGYSIARKTRRYFDELNAAYPILWNYIDDRNSTSLRWLRWGGFKLVGQKAMGPEGLPFHIFARTSYV
jgi:hypothetical protein